MHRFFSAGGEFFALTVRMFPNKRDLPKSVERYSPNHQQDVPPLVQVQSYCNLAGGIFFMFTPIPREMIQFDEDIFQMGWFNHQVVFGCGNFFQDSL